MKFVFKSLLGILALGANLNADIVLISHSFNAVTNSAVDTTGLADWGYVSVAGGFFDSNLGGAGLSYNNTDYGAVSNNSGTVLTTVSGTSSVGPVTLTEGTSGTDKIDPQNNVSNFTFDGSTVHGSYGNFSPSEADIWRITFSDVGIGRHLIKLYMGHSQNNRVFDMDVSFDGGATTFVTTTSPQIGTLGSSVAGYTNVGSSFTYDIEFTASMATDDLTLTFGGVSGGFGGAIFAGYTFANVPEPSSILFFSVATVGFLNRRRR